MSVWPKVPLADVLLKNDCTVALKPDAEYRQVTVRLWGKGVVLRGILNGAEIASLNQTVIRQGQFILSRIDARNGALGLVPPDLDGAVVTSDFPSFDVVEDRLLPAYLGWMCRTEAFVDECRRSSEGTTNRVRLQEDKFLAREIALPSLHEQRRIVARIEELAKDIEEARGLRSQAAEEAHALLSAARREAILGCPAQTVTLDSVCSAVIDNLHSNPRLSDTGVPCVRSPDVGYGTLNLQNAQRTSEAEYRRRTIRGEPTPNDIVLVREGGGTGKCALVGPGQRFSLGQRVMMLRPAPAVILPRYFLHQLLSPLLQEDQILPLSKGSASPHLNIGVLRKFSLRLPTLNDQHRIVEKLDGLSAHLNDVRQLHAEAAAELDALLPAVLDRAFKGEL